MNKLKEFVIKSSGLKPIIELLTSKDSDPPTQEAALFIISCLCSKKDLLKEISGPVLNYIIFSKPPSTIGSQESSVRIICALTPDESNQKVILSKEGLQFIFNLLNTTEEVLQSLAVKCLLILSQNKKNVSALSAIGATQNLKNVMGKTSNKTIVLGCEKVIGFLA